MITSRICLHQVYMYSTCDLASDAAAVDRLIQQRQRCESLFQHGDFDCGSSITVYRLVDSGHCRLIKDHPQEYHQAVQDALKAAIERSTNAATTPPNPSFEG
jgi:Eukaryotic protein of unknown function (DUF829)